MHDFSAVGQSIQLKDSSIIDFEGILAIIVLNRIDNYDWALIFNLINLRSIEWANSLIH